MHTNRTRRLSEFVLIGVYSWLCFSVAMAQTNVGKEKIRYAVVGDSYSCGEGAKPSEAWPQFHSMRIGITVSASGLNPTISPAMM